MSDEFASADHNHEHNSLTDVLPDGPITTFHLDEETHGYLTAADGEPMSLQTDLTNIRNGDDIDDDAIINRHLANDSVKAAQIENGAVTTDKIGDSQVTAPKLAIDSVETAKIKDANVTAAKLSPTGGAEGKVLGFVAGTPDNSVGWVDGLTSVGFSNRSFLVNDGSADTVSHEWTIPTGVSKVRVTIVGSGGGGGGESPEVGENGIISTIYKKQTDVSAWESMGIVSGGERGLSGGDAYPGRGGIGGSVLISDSSIVSGTLISIPGAHGLYSLNDMRSGGYGANTIWGSGGMGNYNNYTSSIDAVGYGSGGGGDSDGTSYGGGGGGAGGFSSFIIDVSSPVYSLKFELGKGGVAAANAGSGANAAVLIEW